VLHTNIYKKCMKIHSIRFSINKSVCFFVPEIKNKEDQVICLFFLLLLNDIVCSVIMILTDDVTKQSHYCFLLLSSFFVFDCNRCVNLFSLVLLRMSSPFTNIFFSVFFSLILMIILAPGKITWNIYFFVLLSLR